MIGVTFPLIVYLIVAISAYIEYKVVNPNILLTLEPENTGRVLFCFLYVAFSLTMLCSFPILFFEGRNAFLTIVDEIILHIQDKPG